MAISYSHKFGQIIGEALEMAVAPFLNAFANEHNLYFDKKEPRPARPGTKLTWIDINGNKHDLDFVLEKNGTKNIIGTPAAFIECAWRRYTKHSKNKAQEIQGAIMPLIERYKKDHPFIGVILGGEFTEGSLIQLQSLGFTVLFFPYDVIQKAFDKVGINAYFDESTTENHFAKQVKTWEILSDKQKQLVFKTITDLQLSEINSFVSILTTKIKRKIVYIRLWTTYGKQFDFKSLKKAKEFIVSFSPESIKPEFEKYETEVEYSNGDIIKASYQNKQDILEFLTQFI
jgi:hypothetical protein